MKSVNEIQKQLNGLVKGIRECNFIPAEDRKDITQNSFVKLIEKMNEGVIVDDATEIRGYVFQVLRNFCLAYHRDKEKKGTSELKWDPVDNRDDDMEEYREELKNILRHKIQAIKYDNISKLFVKFVLEGKDYDTVFKELGIPRENLRRIKQSIVLRLKADLTRPVKYLIKNDKHPNISIPCFTRTDVHQFFPDFPPRRITYMVNQGYVTPEGFYVEILIKRKNSKKHD